MRSYIMLMGLISILHATPYGIHEAAEDIGEEVTVCGKVSATHYAVQSNAQPTYLDMGGAFPNQVFSIVIWGEDRGNFHAAPEELYRGQYLCATGLVETYKAKPLIFVSSPSALQTDILSIVKHSGK